MYSEDICIICNKIIVDKCAYTNLKCKPLDIFFKIIKHKECVIFQLKVNMCFDSLFLKNKVSALLEPILPLTHMKDQAVNSVDSASEFQAQTRPSSTTLNNGRTQWAQNPRCIHIQCTIYIIFLPWKV